MATTHRRPAEVERQAEEHAEQARETMDARRTEASGGVSGWVADRDPGA